jgi:hypothetical protein
LVKHWSNSGTSTSTVRRSRGRLPNTAASRPGWYLQERRGEGGRIHEICVQAGESGQVRGGGRGHGNYGMGWHGMVGIELGGHSMRAAVESREKERKRQWK